MQCPSPPSPRLRAPPTLACARIPHGHVDDLWFLGCVGLPACHHLLEGQASPAQALPLWQTDTGSPNSSTPQSPTPVFLSPPLVRGTLRWD